ncbi:MAG: OmpA domain protein [Myxococcales bacterium]|nr:OmpA domain protein [Myxococcales bacterium]
MIAKRWRGLFVLVVVAAVPRASLAAPSEAPGDFGNVVVKQTAMLPGTISESTMIADVIDLDLTASGCGVFDVTPKTMITVTNATPASITSSFAPIVRGAASCVVTMRDHTTAAALGTFTLTGVGVAPEIAVAPTSKVYGGVRFNDAAPGHTVSQVFTVTNNGDAGKTLTVDLAFSGGQTGDYSITAGPMLPATIAAGANASWTVTFDPVVAGASSTTLRFTSNDPLTPMFDVPLSGTGTNAVIGVSDLTFAAVPVPGSANANISVTNNGAATKGPLTVTSATIMNGNGWFTFNAAPCAGLTTCNYGTPLSVTNTAALVNIKCQPPTNQTGTQMASVVFASDTDDGTDSTAFLSCTANRADVMIDIPMITFPNQMINTTSAATTVTISNIGTNIPLTYSITKAGTNPTQFTVAGTCLTGCSLAAGTSTTIDLAFAPTALLAKSALIRITSNDPDNGTVDISVSGTGVAPHANPMPASITFAATEVGATSAKSVLTVTNTGTADLTVSNAALTAASVDFAITAGVTTMQTIPPNGTATWDIKCSPLSIGAKTGTFQLTSNTDATHGLTADIVTPVTLSCTGNQGILSVVAPSTFNFGGLRVGLTANHTFVLKNTGNVPVTNIGYMLGNTTVGYSVTGPAFPIASLAAGATANVVVQFAPMAGTDGGPVTLTFTGVWGSGATPTMATANIDGDGLTAGYDTSPASPSVLDFGDMRFDTTKLMTYDVIDTDTTAVQILSMNVTPDLAMTGELSLVSYTHGSSTFSCASGCPAVTLNALNDKITVTVKAAPANRVAMLTAHVTVHSDLPTGSDRIVPLAANSITAAIAVTPPTNVLDFGAVDRDLGPVTKTIRIANTGAATLNVGAAVKSGTDVNRFSFSTTNATTVAPLVGTYDVMVTYLPSPVEKPANQYDVAMVTFPLTGLVSGPPTVTIMIQARTIDRHIAVAAVPQFPNTFRNPGTNAPMMPVTVNNTGEAPLDVSAVMVTNGPIWTLLNPNPVTIPGFGSYAFNVSFAPTMAGKAPDGQMMIMNTDNGMPLVVVALQGNGINRSVEMGPPIDLGYTGIGIPVDLSQVPNAELLHVTNMDSTTFKIHALTIDGSSAFSVINAPTADTDLGPSTTQHFDIRFDPTSEGDFEGTATLFLDMDPIGQASVPIKGHAVFVDAHGGGGCSTSRGSGGGAILVIGALLLARRRRGIAVLSMLVAPMVARADEPSRNIELSIFHPTPATTGSGFQLQSPEVGANGDWIAVALVSFASRPLVLGTTANEDIAVRTRTTLEVGGAYAFLDRFEAGARMPLYFQAGDTIDSSMMFGVAPASGTARGDLTLHGKAKLSSSGIFNFGAGAALTLPTATKDQFAGVASPTGRLLGLATATPNPRVIASANLGFVVRATSHFANIDQGSGVAWGAGASFRALDALWASAELFGELIPGGRLEKPAAGQAMGSSSVFSTIEMLGGLHYQLERRISLGLAVGRGVEAGLGAPALRGMFSLSFAPSAAAIVPMHPERVHQSGDRDGDGIPDDLDKCPDEAEDKDMFDDADGCPDPDNDGDGIPDAQDKCPLDAEDKDGFQDDDGCPDKDNDGDGIPDAQDKCPNEAEDKDGFQDLDGCPDPDNDGDGIPDAKDKCPAEPETINGFQDDDGCPDRGDSLVIVSPDRLELLEAISFNGAKIARSSSNVLGQVGATLRAHVEIVRIRITVHVQPTSNSDRDQELSEKRAAAVRDWLATYGIAPSRLEVRGFGGSKPLVPADQRGSSAINERLELIILERK